VVLSCCTESTVLRYVHYRTITVLRLKTNDGASFACLRRRSEAFVRGHSRIFEFRRICVPECRTVAPSYHTLSSHTHQATKKKLLSTLLHFHWPRPVIAALHRKKQTAEYRKCRHQATLVALERWPGHCCCDEGTFELVLSVAGSTTRQNE